MGREWRTSAKDNKEYTLMKIKTCQKGFTLIEMLLTIALTGIITGVILTPIFQTLKIPARSSLKITAMENIKNSAYRISKDLRMAKTTDLIDGAAPVNHLTLNWTSWYDVSGQLISHPHSVVYTLSGVKLMRSYDNGTQTIVGNYINSVEFSRLNQIIYVSINASPENKSQTAERKAYRMYLQPKEDFVP